MPKALTDNELEEMKQFLEEQYILGKSQTTIARETGCSQTRISLWARRLGIIFPRGAGARDQTGNKNSSYKDGASRSSIRRITKSAILLEGRSLNICERCGIISNENLNRHHKNRNRLDNIANNIEIICPACHAKEHNKERKRDNKGRYL